MRSRHPKGFDFQPYGVLSMLSYVYSVDTQDEDELSLGLDPGDVSAYWGILRCSKLWLTRGRLVRIVSRIPS